VSFNPLYLLAAVPVFGLLVIAHEFGHFITAKRSGIRVEEFAIGFPPRLFTFKRGETNYSINLLPIGGYVKMPGENGETTDEAGNYDPRTFGAKPAGIRAMVLLAGVTMNLLLAVVLFSTSAAIGNVEFQPVIQSVTKDSPAQHAGLLPGDRIVAVNGQPIKYFSDVTTVVGKAIQTELNTDAHATSVQVQMSILHAGAASAVTIPVQARISSDPNKPPLGIGADTNKVAAIIRPPLWQAPLLGVQDMGTAISVTAQGIGQVIRGQIPFNEAFQGPVGIVNTTGQFAAAVPASGWSPILFLVGYLSLSLAFFNILPVPGLDGGRLLFVVIEVLRRGKRISPEREALVHLAGMAILLMLVLLVTINDVSHLGR
jgi:regulator of sigma E protease